MAAFAMPTDPTPIHALLVDRDRAFARAADDALRSIGVSLVRVDSFDLTERPAGEPLLQLVLVEPLGIADAFAEIRRLHSKAIACIVVGQHITVADAVRYMRAGANDCLVKPVSAERLRHAVRNALNRTALTVPTDLQPSRGSLDEASGYDQPMREVLATARAAADARATLLITGETGTGKSRLARAIHEHSSRRVRPFVTLACGSLVPALSGSELFGHVRGAFSDATRDAPGRLAAAQGGTLLLDDVDAAPIELQQQLLRVLQERTYEPVGSNVTRTADVRVIATTNADLPDLVRAGRFREDLLHRLNVVALCMPALRDRPSEVTPLAIRFAQAAACEATRSPIAFSPDALDALHRHAWAGNVRELEHVVQRAVLLARGARIEVRDLPPAFALAAPHMPSRSPLDVALTLPERAIIVAALDRNDWNRRATADELGIDRTTLYKKMRRLGLSIAARVKAA